jgi:hypothetical protein
VFANLFEKLAKHLVIIVIANVHMNFYDARIFPKNRQELSEQPNILFSSFD